MPARLTVILVLVAILLATAYSSMFIVTERNQALVLRFGEITRVESEPGLYFKIPTSFVETVQYVDKRLLTLNLDDKVVQVRDGRRYVVDAFATFRINDPRRFREAVSANLTLAADRLRTRLDGALRAVYGVRDFNAALSAERQEMMLEVRDTIRPEAQGLGLEVVDVRIKSTDLPQRVSEQTFERMRSERLAEAAQLRAQGTEASLRIRAEADRQATVIVAEAQRDSEIIRGQGDAERNSIFAAAFEANPEFFEFYRSMAAYERSLTPDGGTTMVLTPDSDFFKYFASPLGGGAVSAPVPAVVTPESETPPSVGDGASLETDGGAQTTTAGLAEVPFSEQAVSE